MLWHRLPCIRVGKLAGPTSSRGYITPDNRKQEILPDIFAGSAFANASFTHPVGHRACP